MSNKYKTGSFQILLFDQYGTLNKTLIRDNLAEADNDGRESILYPPHASYVIMRVITNSLDRSYPWTRSVEVQYRDPDCLGNEANGE